MSPDDPKFGIQERLNAARQRLFLGEASAGVVTLLALVAAAWLVASGTEALLRLPGWGRALLLGTSLLVALGAVARFLIVPLLRRAGVLPGLSDDAVATRIGAAFPDVRDRLLNLLQLLDGRHSDAPAPLVDEAARSLGRNLAHVPVEEVEDFSAVRRAGRLATLPVVALLAFALIGTDGFLGASGRLLAPGADFALPPPYSVSVLPGDFAAVKGSDLEVVATLTGSDWPEEIVLESRYQGEDVSQTIPMSAPPEARHQLVNLRRSFAYRVVAGAVTSPWYEVQVIDRPVVAQLDVGLRYPRYTRLPSLQLPANDGTVTALLGTLVQVRVVVTGPEMETVSLDFGSGRTVDLTGSDRSWEGNYRVRGDDTWKIRAVSAAGVPNSEPIEYRIRATRDAPPTIQFLAPEPAVDLDENARVDVAWRMSDDFGFSAVNLNYRLEESRYGETTDTFAVSPLPLPDPYLLDQTGSFVWSLIEDSGLEPVPGDVFSYFLETVDNNAVSGFGRARTPFYRLRMPSLAERYEALDNAEDRTEEELETLVDEARRVREQFEELRDELRSKTESEWQDERALEQLMEEQQALEESVESIAQQMEELTSEMERNDLVSEETLNLFEELREVAEEVNTPELMEALENLQNAMQQMDMQEMQESLEQFEFSEEMYQQRLERTLELFKNLRLQQDLDEAARRVEELAEKEEELAEETQELKEEADSAEDAEEQNPSESGDQEQQAEDQEQQAENIAQQQEQASEEMEALQEKLEEIAERMAELDKAPDDTMEELADDLERENMPQQMQQNAEQMRQQNFDQAQQEQQDMSESLRSLQQNLEQMEQGMQGAQMQMNMTGIRRALDDVLALSTDQEELRTQVQDLAADSPQLRTTAQQQLRLSEGLTHVADSLQSLARTIPQMGRDVQVHAGEAMREMASATTSMTDRAARRASGHQKGAMTHLNELALMLADLLDQMMNGQGSGGNMSMEQFMQQLQNMAGQQQQLNQQIQQMLNDMQGNRMTQDAQQRLRQLAGQQEQIRQDLRQLSRERTLRNNALGDLDRIAEQMQETIEELQQQRGSRRTVQRQQQILTRLLEASRSMQERGRERQRESRSADQVNRSGPTELTPTERADRLRRDLIRAMEGGYSPDYEDLIRRYFELLQQQDQGPGNQQ